jgi:glycolate oxidase iron-sulfur subunit
MSVQYDRSKYGADLDACVHCGLCLQACPTYLETGSEADSPRGRILMMRSLHSGDLDQNSPDLRRHLDLCLGCRACEPACPSGVHYSELLDVARARMNEARPWSQKYARKFLLDSLSDPIKLRKTLAASGLTHGIPKQVSRLLMGNPDDLPVPLSLPAPSVTVSLPAVVGPVGPRRARVGILSGCVMRVLYGDVNEDTVAILAANGCEVLINQSQGCCGALHAHNGFHEPAVDLAKKLIDSFTPFDGLDAIVINSAGCGSSMKEYVNLLAGDPVYSERASAFSAICKDICEFLDEIGWMASLKSLPIKMTYHDACHLGNAQGIRAAPRQLLENIPELELMPLNESDICCGSAGIYNLTEPAMAKRLLHRKVRNILATGAQAVVTGNPGCIAWIANGLSEQNIPTLHPASVLRASLAADPLFSSDT